jgi:hypothetical protein
MVSLLFIIGFGEEVLSQSFAKARKFLSWRALLNKSDIRFRFGKIGLLESANQ